MAAGDTCYEALTQGDGPTKTFTSAQAVAKPPASNYHCEMPLPEMEMKVLWSRAAGLCSFPECKELLVRFSKDETGFYHIGEMAHLEARSLKGPRGKGMLSPRARNRYENHMLLCPTCHTEIDKSPDAYPVELLNEFKKAHESWVAQTLMLNLSKRISYLQFYESLLGQIETILMFDRWSWMIDHLWRDLAPTEAIESGVTVRGLLLKVIWPGSIPSIEAAIQAVLESWSDFCLHFANESKYRHGDGAFMISYHIYSGMPLKARFLAEEKEQRWSEGNGNKLLVYVTNLNRLIQDVRSNINPEYRQNQGYFIIHDEVGYRNDGVSVLIRPGISD